MSFIKQHVRKIFYLELVFNSLSVLMIVFLPDAFIRGFGAAQVSPELSASFLQFAALLIVITYIMARALFSGNDRALRFTLEGYLIGDFAYLVALVAFVNSIGGVWGITAVIALVITIILIIARIIYLAMHPNRSR